MPFHSAIEEKIRREAEKAGIKRYTLREDQYVFSANLAAGELTIEANTKELVIFHSPSFLIARVDQPAGFSQLVNTGGEEQRNYKAVGGDYRVLHTFSPSVGVLWVYTEYKFPYMVTSRNKINFVASFPTGGLIGASGYILGISVIEY